MCAVYRMEEAEGERRWVLKKGVRMGKQLLVAGLLASSAPVVVPPLVVVSVIGISISIPFGLFLASHACTHKLMSKLLPMPATPSYDVRVEVWQKECVGTPATRGIEMGENEEEAPSPAVDDQRIGDGKKEDPQSSEHIKQVDEGDIADSHKPIPSVVTADETIGSHQESSSPEGNDVADWKNSFRSGYSSASPLNNNEVKAQFSFNTDIGNFIGRKRMRRLRLQVTVNEEKLWTEISAIRVIVGYEGTPQASCVDELRKLYLVAGVEPPPSLLSASGNSFEIHDHLHFLMSILGVKSNGP